MVAVTREKPPKGRGDAPPRRRFRLTRAGRVGLAAVCFWVLVAILAPLLTPFDPTDFPADDAFMPPGDRFLLGTDYLGRDVLSRLIAGTRLTLVMATLATLIATTVGTTLGLLAAYRKGVFDMVASRINDALLSFPTIMTGLVVIAALGSSVTVLVVTTGLIFASSVFRIARAVGMDVAAMDYVMIAKARGESTIWVLFQEILPNAAVPLVVDFGIRLSFAILFMSSLSFLGLGVQPPQADWGSLVRENMAGITSGSWVPLFPAFAIASFTIGLNLMIDDVSASHGRGIASKII